jgi:hypothetical protein
MIGRDARARVDRLEAKLRPPAPPFASLSAWERRELVELEADYRARFPGDVDEWSREQLDDFLGTYATGHDGVAPRLAELRRRAMPASEQAELRANEIAIAAMTADELDQWIAEMVRAAQEETHP